LITHHKCQLGLNIGANEKQRVRWFWDISSGAQDVTLQKYLSYLSLVIYSFRIPPIKPELGLQLGGRLLIAIQLDQSNYLAYQQQQVLGIAVPFTTISILCKNAGRLNPFCRAKPTGFEFSSSNFFVQDHILITGGAAVRSLRRRIREKSEGEQQCYLGHVLLLLDGTPESSELGKLLRDPKDCSCRCQKREYEHGGPVATP
jgi:hypothetical protein